MTDKKHVERKAADQAGKRANEAASRISDGSALTDDEMNAASGGAGHCATGKHFDEVKITARK